MTSGISTFTAVDVRFKIRLFSSFIYKALRLPMATQGGQTSLKAKPRLPPVFIWSSG